MNTSIDILNIIDANNPTDSTGIPKINFLLFDSDTEDYNIITKKLHSLKQEFPSFQNLFLGINSSEYK